MESILVPKDNMLIIYEANNIFHYMLWMRGEVFSSNFFSPFESIIVTHQLTDDFIQNSCRNNHNLMNEVQAHCKTLVSWTWGLKHNKIEVLRICVRTYNSDVRAHKLKCHSIAILPLVKAGEEHMDQKEEKGIFFPLSIDRRHCEGN